MKIFPHRQWDSDATFGSDILGTGSYQNLPEAAGKTKMDQIGFVRSKPAKKKVDRRAKPALGGSRNRKK